MIYPIISSIFVAITISLLIWLRLTTGKDKYDLYIGLALVVIITNINTALTLWSNNV